MLSRVAALVLISWLAIVLHAGFLSAETGKEAAANSVGQAFAVAELGNPARLFDTAGTPDSKSHGVIDAHCPADGIPQPVVEAVGLAPVSLAWTETTERLEVECSPPNLRPPILSS